MTTQQIVPPSQIEDALLRIWDSVDQTRQMRASLFNLIVFNQLSTRTDYIRSIVQRIIDTFPCRVLFVSHDPDPAKHYLKTAVSVMVSKGSGANICDDIDIGVAGSDWERVPYVILPHLLPDLPVYLLWAENPSLPHPLFQPLADLSHRIIFDSESADHLTGFAQTLLNLKDQKGRDIADLNWARLEGWRDMLVSTFNSKDRINDLNEIKKLSIVYNARETDFFCHLKIQAMYLLSLISSRLGWKYESMEKKKNHIEFLFDRSVRATIESSFIEELPPGSILSMKVETSRQHHYHFTINQPHQALINITTHDRCELPVQFILRKSSMGQSLVREIFLKGTSPFFVEALRQLQALDQGTVC